MSYPNSSHLRQTLPPQMSPLKLFSTGGEKYWQGISPVASFFGRTVINSENRSRVSLRDLEEIHNNLEDKLLDANLQPDEWRSIERRFATVVKNTPGYNYALPSLKTESPSRLSGVRNEMSWHDDFRIMMGKVISSEKPEKGDVDDIFNKLANELTKVEYDALMKVSKGQKGKRNKRLEKSLNIMVARHGEAVCKKIMSSLKASNWGQRVLSPSKGSDNGFSNQTLVSRNLISGSQNRVSQNGHTFLEGVNFDNRRGKPLFSSDPSGSKGSHSFQRGERNYQSVGLDVFYSGTSPAIDTSRRFSFLEKLPEISGTSV
ncbi:hypothetical protein [Endozoicomonas atrinae]|uniref:hypothetical protein n=1 Tax=Endozoicomonas atrinae TaxID=1333660 RepID=UPI003AFFCB54